jgi:hypothetical protein
MMKKYGQEQKPFYLDKKELRTNLGAGNFIFVCSGCDLFHPDVHADWIFEILDYTKSFWNKYLWHTKNPFRAVSDIGEKNFPADSTLCVTVESDIPRPGIGKAPQPLERLEALKGWRGKKMITVEPVIEFDVIRFSEMILSCEPVQVNIGADSGSNRLPEPSPEKIAALIEALRSHHVKVHLKKNLKRLYGNEPGKSPAARNSWEETA